MPSTTPGRGIPYVLPADHPLEFPAHSQALANEVDAELTALRSNVSIYLSGSSVAAPPANVWTLVTAMTSSGASGGMTASGGVVTVPVAGLYNVWRSVLFSLGTVRTVGLAAGTGTAVGAWLWLTGTVNGAAPLISVSQPVYLSAGSKVGLWVNSQVTGDTLGSVSMVVNLIRES